MSTMTAGLTVRTWADGYGIWHARVTAPDGTPDKVMREAARAAILAELHERGEASQDYRPALQRVESGHDTAGEPFSVYREDEPHDVPASFPVRVLDIDEDPAGKATCGGCGRSWDDSIGTSWTPVPSARCPFEYFHDDEQDEDDECPECGTRPSDHPAPACGTCQDG